MMLAAGDLIRLFLKFVIKNDVAIRLWENVYMNGLLAVILTIVICIYGYFHAKNIVTKTYNVTIEKQVSNMKNLKIVFFSDTHVGSLIKIPQFDKLLEKINKLDADIILVGGDIYDEGTSPKEKEFFYDTLKSMKSKYGIYYVGGNHEHGHFRGANNAGIKKIFASLKNSGVQVLEDQAVFVRDSFYIIGRKELFSNPNRAKISTLVEEIDKKYPIILLDHQPVDFKGAKESGIDLMFSGHTHGGQIFPIGILSNIFSSNELGYGYKRYGNFQVIVSSGAGVWGVPMRVGTNSEIVVVNIDF
jgi:predicted MPP superfamily phosphohydrolase